MFYAGHIQFLLTGLSVGVAVPESLRLAVSFSSSADSVGKGLEENSPVSEIFGSL